MTFDIHPHRPILLLFPPYVGEDSTWFRLLSDMIEGRTLQAGLVMVEAKDDFIALAGATETVVWRTGTPVDVAP